MLFLKLQFLKIEIVVFNCLGLTDRFIFPCVSIASLARLQSDLVLQYYKNYDVVGTTSNRTKWIAVTYIYLALYSSVFINLGTYDHESPTYQSFGTTSHFKFAALRI